jgi:hypothetical protein
MSKDTLQLLLDLLSQVRISPMQPDAEQLLKRFTIAKKELEGELGNGLRAEG